MDLLKNEPPWKECYIIIIDDENKREEVVEGEIKAKVDVSSITETDVDDYEAERAEDEVILIGDGENQDKRRYATELCIPNPTNLGQ
jgi:hypothetical protein